MTFSDVIAISGDLADGFVRNLHDAAKPLCNLKPKKGVFFATGRIVLTFCAVFLQEIMNTCTET